MMDSRDNIQIIDNSQEESVLKRKMRRLFLDWHYYLPLIISIICAILTVCVLIVASVELNQLRAELDALKTRSSPQASALQGDGDGSPQNDTQSSSPQNDTQSSSPQNDTQSSSPQNDTQSSLVSSGAAYVRWGRRDCPDDNQKLYTGFSVGASSSGTRLSGGGANLLCMHPEAQWNKYDSQPNDTTGYTWIYAAEFMPYSMGILPEESHGHNYPCSMCESPRTSQITVYGRRDCPGGWTREYEGYIMSSAASQTRLMFECIDSEPEYIPGTGNITGGAMMFFTSAYCRGNGAITFCPPYIHARELTCVLCTK